MVDRIIRYALRHPIVVVALAGALLAAGAFALQRLSVDAFPDVTNVQVQINTAAPGFSPLETEQRITFPLETALAGLPRLVQMRSLSRYVHATDPALAAAVALGVEDPCEGALWMWRLGERPYPSQLSFEERLQAVVGVGAFLFVVKYQDQREGQGG